MGTVKVKTKVVGDGRLPCIHPKHLRKRSEEYTTHQMGGVMGGEGGQPLTPLLFDVK